MAKKRFVFTIFSNFFFFIVIFLKLAKIIGPVK